MSAALNALITALREELQQYGEMLARLDEQQGHVMNRHADDLLVSVASVQAQGLVLHQVRGQREQLQAEVAQQIGLTANAPFTRIIPALPEDYRPLLSALVQENNELLVRVQQRARQNHLLLARSVELMQRFLGSLGAFGNASTYGGNGSLVERSSAPSLYETVV